MWYSIIILSDILVGKESKTYGNIMCILWDVIVFPSRIDRTIFQEDNRKNTSIPENFSVR
jgi:hypothetical protein